jgi:hypothetical protein
MKGEALVEAMAGSIHDEDRDFIMSAPEALDQA